MRWIWRSRPPSSGDTSDSASPCRARAAGAADAVDVVLGHHRQVVVDHQRQVGNVEPARGDIGRDQHARLAGLEVAQGFLALRLALVAVDRDGLEAGGFQLFGQAVAAVLGLAEHQHLVGVALGQDVDQQVALARAVDRMRAMHDGFGDGVAAP